MVNFVVTEEPTPRVILMTYGKLPQAMTYQKRPVCPTYRRPVVLQTTTYMRAPNLVTYGKLPRTEPPTASNLTNSNNKGRRLDLGIEAGSGDVMTVIQFEESNKQSEVIEVNGESTMERMHKSGKQIEIVGADGNVTMKILEQSEQKPKAEETNEKGATAILVEITQPPNTVETTEDRATQIMEQNSQKTEADKNIIEKKDDTEGNLIQKDEKRIKKMIKYISERIKNLRENKKKKNDAYATKKGWLLKKETPKSMDQLHEKRANLVRKRMKADNIFKWMRGSWKKQKGRRKRDLSIHPPALQGTFTYLL